MPAKRGGGGGGRGGKRALPRSKGSNKKRQNNDPVSQDDPLTEDAASETSVTGAAAKAPTQTGRDVEEEVHEEEVEEESSPNEEDDDEPEPAPSRKTKKSRKTTTTTTEPPSLSPEDEMKVIDFLIANPFIYDKSLREYKVTAAKTAKWQQLAKDLGVDHFGLIKWYESMRTMYGRITSEGKKGKSGESKKKETLTYRQKWCKDNLGFLDPHIKRIKGQVPSSVSMKNYLFHWIFCYFVI
jgi:hypothetical protein